MEKKERFTSLTSAIKFVSGIISWVLLVILVIIAGFLMYYFVSARIYASKGESFKPAFSLYTILSPSMVPNIKVYDVIVDVNVNKPEDIHEGDVITFISTSILTKGMTITHRVVQVNHENGKYSYVTKGDANVPVDGSPAEFENVLGKVVFRIPQLGRLQEFLGTKGGWLVAVVIPALYIILSDIIKVFRLRGAKNQVDSFEQKEKTVKDKVKEQKEITEAKLIRKYTKVRSDTEPDPIPKKEFKIVEKNSDIKDIPKLKNVNETEKKKAPNRNRNRRKSKKSKGQ